jgi:hypothetical protein
MPSTDDEIIFDETLFEIEIMERCYHEAGHAVFAYHDGILVSEVIASSESGACEILYADDYERYTPWRYALFCLAGAYVAYVAVAFSHPKPEALTLALLLEDARKKPDGDAGEAVRALRRIVGDEDSVFDSLEEAYAYASIKLARLVKERWPEIEAVAEELFARFWESEEALGRLGYEEVAHIVERTCKEANHA